MGFYLNLVCEDVVTVNTNSSSEIFEQLIRIGEKDVIIGISFPRYSMRTLKALEFASNRKAKSDYPDRQYPFSYESVFFL